MPRTRTSPGMVFGIGAGLIIFGLLFAVYGVPLITNAINPPTTPTTVTETGYKTVTASGSIVDPQSAPINPTAGGGVGTCAIYDSAGGVAGSGTIDSAGHFSADVPSGAEYTAYVFFTSGGAITWWWDTFSMSVPGFTEESEVDSYQLPNAFTVYPKSVAWTERISFGGLGTMAQSYTANAWGGTQTYTAHTPDIYTAIVAGTTYLISIDMIASTAYSALGWSGSIPAHPSYSIEPVMVLWTNRTDWSLVNPGTANAVRTIINGTVTVFIAKLPVVKAGSIAVTESVSFSILTATAGQGHWGANFVLNSTQSYIGQTGDYKVNGPPGYGAVFYGVRFVIGHCG